MRSRYTFWESALLVLWLLVEAPGTIRAASFTVADGNTGAPVSSITLSSAPANTLQQTVLDIRFTNAGTDTVKVSVEWRPSERHGQLTTIFVTTNGTQLPVEPGADWPFLLAPAQWVVFHARGYVLWSTSDPYTGAIVVRNMNTAVTEASVPVTGSASGPVPLSFTPSRVDFGEVPVSSNFIWQTVTVTNTGSSQVFLVRPLDYVPFYNPDAFFFRNAPNFSFMAPGEVRTFDVGFKPPAAGSYSATVRLEAPVTTDILVVDALNSVSVTGTGINATQPTITSQPTNQMVCSGTSVSFTAAANGVPAPTVQWQVKVPSSSTFANIPGATSTTLAFNTAADNGNLYRAVFTNVAGTATTNAATLTVTTPPSVTTNPIAQVVCQGNSVALTAGATGQPAPAVRWQVSTGGPFTDIPGATGTTLAFTPVAADNGNLYQAVFTNSCGTVSTLPAQLAVNTSPTVTASPTDQTVPTGNSVNFTTAASGSPTPTVQWQVNGGTGFADIPGATSTTLTFTASASDNGNQYRAIFTNGCGTAATAAATLTTNRPPVARCKNVTVSAGTSCMASASIDDGSSDPDGDPITVVLSPAGPYGLGTTPVTLTVTDSGGLSSQCSGTVTVVDTTPPTITLNGANPLTVECHTSFADPGGTATDGCAGSVQVTTTGSVDANTPGSYTLTYSADDGHGNTATATRTVTVVDTTAPSVALNGASALTVECHGSFTDPGATASDACAGSLPVSIGGTVNVNTPGTYTLTYSASDPSGNAAVPAVRTVTVVDTTAPVITLAGGGSVTVECHGSFTDPGATASDACAGSVPVSASGSVDVNTPGTYTITYSATDGTNSAVAARTVTVVDTTRPVITLNGASSLAVDCASSFSDPGATATDACAGSVPVSTSGSVNLNAPGSYTLTYTASDPAGNSQTATRTVLVTYAWSGVLPPINPNGTSIFKLGSTVPVKFQLLGCGAGVSNLVVRIYLAKVSDQVVGNEIEATSTSAADTGNVFRYSSGQYIFNLGTRDLSEGTWQIRIDLGDGAAHTVLISLKN